MMCRQVQIRNKARPPVQIGSYGHYVSVMVCCLPNVSLPSAASANQWCFSSCSAVGRTAEVAQGRHGQQGSCQEERREHCTPSYVPHGFTTCRQQAAGTDSGCAYMESMTKYITLLGKIDPNHLLNDQSIIDPLLGMYMN
jgi:hypothetical protein